MRVKGGGKGRAREKRKRKEREGEVIRKRRVGERNEREGPNKSSLPTEA